MTVFTSATTVNYQPGESGERLKVSASNISQIRTFLDIANTPCPLGVESVIIHPHRRDTEGAVKDITYFDEAAGHSDDGKAAGHSDNDQAAGGSCRRTAVNEALQQYQELHKVEMRRKEEEHVKQIRRKDEEIYKLQAKVIALLEAARSQPRSVGVGQAD